MTEFRTFGLEMRADGRTIYGRAVPFGQPIHVNTAEYGHVIEDFAPGAIDTSLPSELLAGHPQSGLRLPVATGTLEERADGVHGTWPVERSGLGDHVLGMVHRGEAGGLSVGFDSVPGGDLVDTRAGRVTRKRVHLDHVALTSPTMNAYPDAVITDVRAVALRDQLSTAEINNLSDDDFAYIEPGGTKDASGRTVPRSLRHFPIHDKAHVRNALARLSSSPFGDKARPKVVAAAKRFGIEVAGEGRTLRGSVALKMAELWRRESRSGDLVELTPAQEIAAELAFAATMRELRASIGARYGRR